MQEEEFNEETEYDKLQSKYDNLKNGVPNSLLEEEEFETLIQYYQHRTNKKDLLELLEIGLRFYPNSLTILIEKANYYLEHNKILDAKNIFLFLQKIHPNDFLVFILEMEILLLESKISASFTVFKNAIEVIKNQNDQELLMDFYIEVADLFENFELYEEAYNCVIDVLKIDELNISALNRVLYLSDVSNNFEKTKDIFLLKIDKNPYDIHAWINLGIIYNGLKLYEKSIESFKYALVIDDKNFIIYNMLLISYVKLKDYNKAIETYLDGIQLDTPIPFDIDFVADIFIKLKKFDNARELYFKILNDFKTEKPNFYIIDKIANSYFVEKNYKEAIEYFNKIVKEKDAIYNTNYKLAMCYYNIKKYDLASEYFAKCIFIKPKKIKPWSLMIHSLILNEDYVEAVKKSLTIIENIKNNNIKERCRFLYLASLGCFKLDLNRAGNSFFSLAYERYPSYVTALFKNFPEAKELSQINKIITKNKKE